MELYYQSLPELNMTLNSTTNDNLSLPNLNKSQDLKQDELAILNELEETCKANEGKLN
jgi:hypothetical protein